jgi:hypothetical protein
VDRTPGAAPQPPPGAYQCIACLRGSPELVRPLLACAGVFRDRDP